MTNVFHAHMTEAQLQDRVVDLAKARGWRVAHFRPARTKDGSWRTPVQGDKGFPDIVLARDGRVIFAELKSETGRLGEGQAEWLQNLEDGPDAHDHVLVRLWRPSDWPEITEVLE